MLFVGVALGALAVVDRTHRPGPLAGVEAPPVLDMPVASPVVSRFDGSATSADVRHAVTRAFGACVEPLGVDLMSVSADFNGDGWQDLAVLVQPSKAHLYELNDPYRNWSVEDLASEAGRGVGATVGEGERLLALIHGEGQAGWRSPEARQAFLLKNVVAGKLGVVHPPEVGAAARASRLRGDGLSLGADAGVRVVYWTGARYALLR